MKKRGRKPSVEKPFADLFASPLSERGLRLQRERNAMPRHDRPPMAWTAAEAGQLLISCMRFLYWRELESCERNLDMALDAFFDDGDEKEQVAAYLRKQKVRRLRDGEAPRPGERGVAYRPFSDDPGAPVLVFCIKG